jgi:thioredoxin 1
VNQRYNEKVTGKAVKKIIVPALLICVVAGIWFLKNYEKRRAISPKTNNSAEAARKNPDFELHVTEKIDIEKLKTYRVPIVIDFGADTCIPCKEMAPVLKELYQELQGKAIIKFVDVWKYEAFSEGYPVRLIPTQIFIDAKGNPFKPKDPKAMGMTLFSLKETGEHVFTAHEGGMTKEQMMKVLNEMGLE